MVDFSHHLSVMSRSRQPSPLKDIIKYMSRPGMISLAGGLPHPSLFPYQALSIDAFTADSRTDPDDPSVQPSIDRLSLVRDGPRSQNTLSKAMQYTGGSGDIELQKWCHAFTQQVFKPVFPDHQTLIHSGNTDAWAKVVQLLCDPGEHILVEQFVYPSAQAFYIPLGCKGVPIPMDGDGLQPGAMKKILDDWETTHPDTRRPHVLYTVPVGQNPSGCTLTLERKKAVYDLAVEYDLIIVEDDPYYWLQLPEWRSSGEQHVQETELLPTFLHFDTEGRVIRLDTFSKTIAPGSRLGYFTCNPLFAERLLRATEVTTQSPSGWSQAITMEVLKQWGIDGFLLWLTNLRNSYAVRRDWMCNAINKHFELKPAEVATDGLTAYLPGQSTPIFSFVPPRAGMFIWAKFHLSENRQYRDFTATGLDKAEAAAKWADAFWHALIENNLLLTPGSYYVPWEGPDAKVVDESETTFFRLAFSYEMRGDIEQGIERFATVVKQSWKQ